jgi:hypothetical protein
MDGQMTERRGHQRADPSWAHRAKATLRPGHPISIVNISRGGALVEGQQQMRPGTRVLLQIATPTGALGLSAIVLRCIVGSLTSDAGVVYRGALKFDDRRDWTRELGVLAG